MQAAIYIEITSSPSFNYEKPVINTIKASLPELVTFDVDTLSESSLINYTKDLIAEASQYILIIEVKDNSSSAKVMSILETNLKYKEKALVILNGSSPLIEKMLSLMSNERLVKNLSEAEQIQAAERFLKSAS